MPDVINVSEPTPKMDELLRKSGSLNPTESLSATMEMATALQEPLRQGVMSGDVTMGIYQQVPLAPDASPEFPLDFVEPGKEKDFIAYTLPNHGRLPERNIEGDYVMVNTYEVGNAIDWLLRYARNTRWDIVSRALQVLKAGFVKKINDDSWHTTISAGADRNILVYDADASAGQFTKRLVSLMKTIMKRNGGGNSASLGLGRLTDLYISPEGFESIRDWKIDQVDDATRNAIFNAPDGSLVSIFGVNLHELFELGAGQEYQNFFTSDLSGSLASGDIDLVVGLDQEKKDAFVMPVKQPLQIFPDETMHRQRRTGFYGWVEFGLGVLDGRRVLVGSF